MANMLDRNNKHLFLEPNSDSSNSFIANVNSIASKFEELVRIDEKFDAEAVKLLVQLVKNSLDINIKQISEDLRKGSANGYRKLDISFITNFKDYDYLMTAEEKAELLSVPANQIYYKSIDVYFVDNTSISKTFTASINNARQLFSEIDNWEELKLRYADTFFNIINDPEVEGYELLRFTDSTLKGSDIAKIVLHIATNENTAYDAVFVGAKSYAPEFTWTDTTSALITIAHRINDILYAAEYVEQLGENFSDTLETTLAQLTALAEEAQVAKEAAIEAAENADKVLQSQLGLKVTTTVLEADKNPTVLYNAAQHTLAFGLPRSEIAVVGLNKFAVNTANGHLTFNTIRDDDVKNVYINDSGNIIIELNK